MDLAPSPVGGSHSQDHADGYQLPSADSPPAVFSTSAPRQRTFDLPGKVIGQRQVDRCDTGLDTEYSGAHELAARLYIDSADDEHVDVPDRLSGRQTSEQDDGDSSWQVVTRRRPERKRQQSRAAASGRGKNSVRANRAPAGHLPGNSSAGSGVTRQRRRQGAGPLLSSTSCLFWSSCIESFARLSEVDWTTFCTCLKKFHHFLKIDVTMDDFLRFHHLMTKGPQAIRSEDDVHFLIDPFKIMLSDHELSVDALFLSLTIERAVPGFLGNLEACFITGLTRVGAMHRMLPKIRGLLVHICEEDKQWFDRLGWSTLPTRYRCQLFSSMSMVFTQESKIELIRNLHRQVGGSWLEQNYYFSVQKLLRGVTRADKDAHLRDLKASMRANFTWLDARLFIIPEKGDRHLLMVRYARIIDKFIEVMDCFDPQPYRPPTGLLLGVWQVVAQCTVLFRTCLSSQLGFDRTIVLLGELLRFIGAWSELENQAFSLRLTLIRTVLMKCECLLDARNCTAFSQAWHQHEDTMKSNLAECNQFVSDCQPGCATESTTKWNRQRAWLELSLRESKFNRLSCESCRMTRQQIQEHLAIYRDAYTRAWALSSDHKEAGAIELAKWYFLAEEQNKTVDTLFNAQFTNFKLMWKKADLLISCSRYQLAVDEFRLARACITGSDQTRQQKRNEIDDRIAMTELKLYQAEGGIDHLISAYRLSLELLGRCNTRDRGRFEGVLARIVIAMKCSGLRFQDYVGQTSVLGYLVRDGCGIKSWDHFANLLYIRHKLGLSSVDSVNKVADKVGGGSKLFFGIDKKS